MRDDALAVDTSAIIAIILEEPDMPAFRDRLASSSRKVCSGAAILESTMVLSARAPGLTLSQLQGILTGLRVHVVAIDPQQALIACEAFLRFGKGRHPAALNFGDCLSYALAKSLNVPLLYKGNDFSRTDIVSALAPSSQS